MRYIGLDVGSTTAKVVVMDEQQSIIYKRYERHNALAREAVLTCLEDILSTCGDDEVNLTVTGSVGMGLSERYGVPFVQEVVAAAKVVKKLYPQIATMIDIGGEDAKVVFFHEGEAKDLRMNGNCAGGTGAFIDQMAIILGVDISELNRLAMNATHVYPIASRCGVFCKTDVQNLVAKNVKREDIAASIFHAVAVQTVTTLAHGCTMESPLLLCGGPLTFIPALRKAFMEYLNITEKELVLPEDGELLPALGASLSMSSQVEKSQVEKPVTLSGLVCMMKEDAAHPRSYQSTLKPLFKNSEEYKQWRERHSQKKLKRSPLNSPKGGAFIPKSFMNPPFGGNEGGCTIYIGIDSGSTTTKIVAIDEQKRLLYSFYKNNGGNPIETVKEGLMQLNKVCEENDIDLHIAGSCSTGYGEELIKAAFGLKYGVVETMAHYMAARYLDPQVSFVLDIGGQDMKAIFVNNGVIDRIEINEACSSGCGSFIETFAKTLGHRVDEFSKLACLSHAPCDLGTRCTVFMNSKVKQVVREGADINDISAGLAYSVVKNCLYKVLKLKDVAALGKHIVVQGGTMNNDAVVRALELLTESEVSRCDRPELMGAFGCAIYALEHRQTEPARLTDILEQANFTVKQTNCRGCENQCLVQHYRFGNGQVYYSGNRCEKIFSNAGKAKQKGENLYHKKLELLIAPHNPPKETAPLNPPKGGTYDSLSNISSPFGIALPRQTRESGGGVEGAVGVAIGIPRVLNMYEEYPFWRTLFEACHIRTILSKESSYADYERNARMVMSDNVCFPAKLVHSHIDYLQAQGVDRIFMPFVLFEQQRENEQNSYNCPIVSGYSAVVKSVQTEIPIDSPTISFRDPKQLKQQCSEYLATLGIDEQTAAVAIEAASAALAQYNKDIADANLQALEAARRAGRTCILLAGRPYHSDMLIQHKVSDMMAEMGICVLTDDIVRTMDINIDDTHFLSQWSFPNRIMKAAKWCAMQGKDVQYVQFTSFGCGPDAFILDVVRELLARYGKTLTLLKLDDINNIGSMRLRVRSLIGSLAPLNLPNSPANLPKGEAYSSEGAVFHTTPAFTEKYRKRKILIPYFTSFISPLLPSVLRVAGYEAINLPLSDNQSGEYGLKYANNEICYPATLIVGDIIKAFETGMYRPEDCAVAITQTGGQCRASNYLPLIKKALTDAGHKDVPVVSLTFGNDLGNDQPAFKINWLRLLPVAMRAILYSDCISKFYYASAVREKKPGEALELRDLFLRKGSELIETGHSSELNDYLGLAAKQFNEICADKPCPKVGVVGEIYLKFNPFAQRNVVDWLIEQGIEVVPPILTDFFMQSFVNRKVNVAAHLAKRSIRDLLMNGLYKEVNRRIKKVNRIASEFHYYTPFHDIFDLAREAEKTITLNAQFGEGWLLVADITAFAQQGVMNVISLQPFGCIANQIVSKGVEKRLKSLFPDINILSLDFDSGVSDLNVKNRLVLFIDSLKNESHA